MRKGDWSLSLIVSCIALVWPAPLGPRYSAADSQEVSKVAIRVSNVTYDCATGIRFGWSIKNNSSDTVFIYTTFLTGPAADSLEHHTRTSTIVIPSSVKSEVSFPPYSYPEPTFRALIPQESIEGTFSEPISSQLSCKLLLPKRLIFEVAWGSEPSQVKAEILRIKKEGRLHPANPIVHWANLVRSKPVAIEYVGRMTPPSRRNKPWE